MTPGSFDFETSREMVGDAFARSIEAKARADAGMGKFDPPARRDGVSYWSRAQDAFERVVYAQQYKKAMLRQERMKENNGQRQDHRSD